MLYNYISHSGVIILLNIETLRLPPVLVRMRENVINIIHRHYVE